MFLLSVVIVGIGISTNFRSDIAQQPGEMPDDEKKPEFNKSAPKPATGELTWQNYGCSTPAATFKVNTTQQLKVNYSLGAEYLITGVRYLHQDDTAAVPLNLTIWYKAGADQVPFYSYPYSNLLSTWVTSKCFRGPYIVSSYPQVVFQSPDTNPSIAIGGCTSSAGHSASSPNGVTWTTSLTHEYMIQLIFEDFPVLPLGGWDTGAIDTSDLVDGYNITLFAGHTYDFKISRSSGTGDLFMYVVNYTVEGRSGWTPLNSTYMFTADQSVHMQYTPSVTANYMLAVEPAVYGETASYLVDFHDLNAIPPSPSLLTVTADSSTGQVIITWGSVPGADSYKVYYNTYSITSLADFGVTLINTFTTTTTQYTQLYGSTVYYVVTALNQSGGESGISNCISAYMDYPSTNNPIAGFPVYVVLLVIILPIVVFFRRVRQRT